MMNNIRQRFIIPILIFTVLITLISYLRMRSLTLEKENWDKSFEDRKNTILILNKGKQRLDELKQQNDLEQVNIVLLFSQINNPSIQIKDAYSKTNASLKADQQRINLQKIQINKDIASLKHERISFSYWIRIYRILFIVGVITILLEIIFLSVYSF